MSKKAKITIICLAVAIVVIAAVVIPLAVLKFNSPTQLKTPAQPEVIESTDLIVIKTSQIENAKRYVFEITIPNGTTQTLESDSNVLTLDFLNQSSTLKPYFDYAGVYSVKCYAVAENESDNSLKSPPKNFTRQLNLNQPELVRKNGSFIWEGVNHADYYEIEITSNNTSNTKVVVATQTADGLQSITLNSLIEEFNLQANQYSICLRACSDNPYYTSSYYSNQILFTIA